MTSEPSSTPGEQEPRLLQPSRSRKRQTIAFIGIPLVLVSAGLLIWHTWPAKPMPPPPELDLNGVDPAISEAISAARADVLKNPRSASAWGQLGKALRPAEFNEAASFCFGQAEKLEPDNVRWVYLRGEALNLQDPPKAAIHLRRAVQVCERIDTDNIIPRLRLAEVLMRSGNHEEADSVVRRTLELDPDNPTARFYLGILAGQRGDWEDSRKQLLTCQYSEFTRQRACLELAGICERLGRKDEAVIFEKKARELTKDFNWPDKYSMDYKLSAAGKQTRLQYVDRLEMQGKHGEALQMLREILNEGPDYRVLVGLGRLLGQGGDLEGAENALRQAIQLTDSNAKAYRLLAGVLITQGDALQRQGGGPAKAKERFSAALEAARSALAQKPDDAETYIFQGLAQKRLGQKEAALGAFESAVQCGPNLFESHFYLAEALTEAGKAAEARPHWEQVVQLAAPDHPQARIAADHLR
jgi:tetratricopeptide (TPR) repeat protein